MKSTVNDLDTNNGEVRNPLRIHRVALHCIFLRILSRYARKALL